MYVCVCILIYEICIGYKTAHISYWHDIIMMIGVYCSFVNLKYVFKTQNVFFFFSVFDFFFFFWKYRQYANLDQKAPKQLMDSEAPSKMIALSERKYRRSAKNHDCFLFYLQ